MEKKHILMALQQTDWKISGAGGAGELLGLNAKTLGSKMRRLGIKRSDFIIKT